MLGTREQSEVKRSTRTHAQPYAGLPCAALDLADVQIFALGRTPFADAWRLRTRREEGYEGHGRLPEEVQREDVVAILSIGLPDPQTPFGHRNEVK